jgi:hypothetical protein
VLCLLLLLLLLQWWLFFVLLPQLLESLYAAQGTVLLLLKKVFIVGSEMEAACKRTWQHKHIPRNVNVNHISSSSSGSDSQSSHAWCFMHIAPACTRCINTRVGAAAAAIGWVPAPAQ